MRIDHAIQQIKRWGNRFMLLCLLIDGGNIGSAQQIAQAAPAHTLLVREQGTAKSSAESNCTVVYEGGNGWVLDMCASDPNITTPMKIVVNGVSQGNAALVRIYHQSQNDPGIPQLAILYASGYVRLKQNADPNPSIPFGTSFILGPAYWSDSSVSPYHNPQINQLEIYTAWLPDASLRMRAQGTNHDFDVIYDMRMPPPRDRQTRLHVTQTYTATANINIDPTRRTEHQGFKLVQASSMFINATDCAASGYTACHDSNAVRYVGNDLRRQQYTFSGPITFYFGASPKPLGSTWVDILHTDDTSWQGNTPNVRIALDDLPLSHTITPQGSIEGGHSDPRETDNVGLWLHDDGPASVSWQAGDSDTISYWLLAQDNPPEPWEDLGLRPGLTFLDFEGSYNCFLVKEVGQPTTGTVTAINGYTDTALQLGYDLSSNNGNWVQVRCNFNPPLDLSAYDHLRFDWRGDPAAANSLEIGLINPKVGGENIFARGYHHPTHHAWWGQMVIPFSFLHSWTNGTTFDPSQVSALFISVVKDPVADVGGSGSIAIDNLNAYNVKSRVTPGMFESVAVHPTAAQAAAGWLVLQQKSTGLLKSWQEENVCVAHTYDQALALIVFADQGMWNKADALVGALAATQNSDGSWFKSRNCENLASVDNIKWEGDIAWAVYALSRYLALGGTHPLAGPTLQKGADYLGTIVDPVDGCIAGEHKEFTEATIDLWWAFQAAGSNHTGNANDVKDCLLMHFWDDEMGRFKGGWNWWQPYLDNQSWGAAFLKAIGETEKARRALSYVRDVLLVPAQGGQLFGYDGQAGPWSVWNEGTAQYIAAGGEDAGDMLLEVLGQQENDGGMVGSPDEFSGGGVWTTRWHGVAPTAWLYNALCGEPFHPGSQSLCTQDTRNKFINWSGGVSITADQNVVAVGRPHVGTEVTTYNGFTTGGTTAYVPMLFKQAFDGSYDSALYIQNVDSRNMAHITIKFYNANGAQIHSMSDTLAPLASKGYWLPNITQLGASWVGGVKVESDVNIVAVGRPHIGSQIMTYNGFATGSLKSYVPMLFKDAFGGSYDSALYIQNVSANTATITLKFHDNNGVLIHSINTTVLPLASKGYWLPSIPQLGPSWVGGVVVESDQNIATVARLHIGAQITTYSGLSGGETRVSVPMLFKKAFGGGYNAALYVMNTDTVNTAAITIKYYDTNGNLICSVNDPLPALAIRGYWVPNVDCLPDGWVGGTVVEADRNILALGRPHVGNEVTAYTGFFNGSLNAYVPMLFRDAFGGSYDSALYFQNTNLLANATVTLKFYNGSGQLSCSKQVVILPGATSGFWLPSLICD